MSQKEVRSDTEADGYNGAHAHKESGCEKYTSCRWIIGYLCCAARLAQSALRQIMGMVIVCMTLQRVDDRKVEMTSQTPTENTTLTNDLTIASEFMWSSEFEGLVLASYTFGFIASPIAGGYIAGKFGGKNVITVALTIGSVATLATPAAARYNHNFLLVLRAIAGLFMGTVDPSVQSLWSKWAPKEEMASLTSCAYSGVNIAGILTFFVSGYLCSVSFDTGWPLIFYVFGGFTLLCVIPWVIVVYDSPQKHPRITDREIKLITRQQTPGQADTKKPSPPFRKMFTSTAFWAIIIAHVSFSWVTSWVVTYLPKYMKQILKYSVQEDGLLSSLPFVGRFLSGLVCGYISDQLLRRHLLSTAKTRKLFQLIGSLGCAACTIPIGFLDYESRTLAVVLLVLGLSLQNFTSVAFRINHLDIAPRFAGVMMGITLTCAMFASLSAPLITAALIKEGTREEWQIVFWIVGGLNIIGAIFFVVFAKAHELDWSRDESCQIVTMETNVTLNGKLSSDNQQSLPEPHDLQETHTDDEVHNNWNVRKRDATGYTSSKDEDTERKF